MLAQDRLDQARLHYEEALRLDPDFVEAKNNLAYMAMQDGRNAEAAMLLDEIIQTDPDYANAWLNRGIIASDVDKDRARALECWRRYVELEGARADQVRQWIRDLESRPAEHP